MNEKLNNWINWVLYDELIDGKINAPKHLLGNQPLKSRELFKTIV